MSNIQLTHRGAHYFHFLMKVYAGSRTSGYLSLSNAWKAANYQMMIVGNDRVVLKTYAFLAAIALVCAVALSGHIASLHILLGFVVVALSTPLSAYISIILAERYLMKLPMRYGVWYFGGAIFILLLFWPLHKSYLNVSFMWLVATFLSLSLLILITHFHYGKTLHFSNFLKATLKNALQDLLPNHVKGNVIRLSARDKYVAVRTDRGEAEIRLTLSEAIQKNAQPGYRIHRSHWVSGSHIDRVFRKNKKWFLTIDETETLPVSAKLGPQIQSYHQLSVLKQNSFSPFE